MKIPTVSGIARAVLVCALLLLSPDSDFVPGRLKSIAMAQVIPGETVTVHADSNLGAPRRFTGFLHGITYDPRRDYTSTIDLMSALNPALWRLSNQFNDVYGFVATRAEFPRNHGTLITYVIQDAFNTQYGKPIIVGNCDTTRPNCFARFDDLKAAWVSYIDTFVQTAIATNLTIHYYDVFAEPNGSWTGVSYPQILELFRAAHDVVRQRQPQAKIVAPSIANYNSRYLKEFVAYVAGNKLRLDALSWHEFGAPDSLPAHVDEARQFFSANPSLCIPACPEIHINEYAGSRDHLIPGWAVGWLHYLEKAEVDQSHRACWDVIGGWSTCWAGINGVLLQDNVTRQHIYWVYKWHADTLGGTRLNLDTTSAKVVALARQIDSSGEISILLGRYDGAAGNVALEVRNYQYGSADVTVEKIPSNFNVPSAFSAPMLTVNSGVSVTGGSARITLYGVLDGEAYLVKLKPGSQRLRLPHFP